MTGIVRSIGTLMDMIGIFLYLKLYKRIDRIQSNTSYSDLQFLFLAAKEGWGEGCIVEIGSYKGRSAVALALGSKSAGREKVFSVDPHIEGTLEIFRQNLNKFGVADYVNIMVCNSDEASRDLKQKVRLLFIDGLHYYEYVKKDISAFKDMVIDGGIIAFHDYNFRGVARVIKELEGQDEFIFGGVTGCTMFFTKRMKWNELLFEKIELFNRVKKILLRR